MNAITSRLAASGAALLALGTLGLAASPAYAGDATFPPTAVADSYSIPQDNDLVVGADIGLLANDSSGGNAGLEVAVVSTSPDGTLNFGADGHFRFIPNPGFVGTAHFVYSDVASGYTSNDADIWIEVTAIPPRKLIGAPDFYTTPMDTTVYGVPGINELIANDPDATYVGGIDDVTGEVVVDIYGGMSYTPAPGFVGTKTFSYFLDDHKNIPSDWILVTIEVTAPAIVIIPSEPIVPTHPDEPTEPLEPVEPQIPVTVVPEPEPVVDTLESDLPTLAYTGTDDVTTWLLAPGIALLGLGVVALYLGRRRARA